MYILIIIKNILYKFISSLQSSEYFKNIITIISGTFLAQAITIAVSPVITRLYSPADLGLIAFYLSISNILLSFSTGKYELAIYLVNNDDDRFNLLALAIGLNILTAIIVFVVVILLGKNISVQVNASEIADWLFFLPISTLLGGISIALNNWLNEKKKYKNISYGRVFKAFTSSSTQIFGDLAGLGVSILLYANLLAQFIETMYYSLIFNKLRNRIIRKVNYKRILALMRLFEKFPKYSIPSDFVSNYSSQNPIILLGIFFGNTIVGQYALTQSVLGFPIALIARSTTEVYKQRASKDYLETGNCYEVYLKTLKALFFLSIFPTIIFFIIAPWLFSSVFGIDWVVAGEYGQYLTMLFFLRFIVSPLGYTLYIVQKQDYNLIWQLGVLILTTLGILIGVYFESARLSVILFSVTYSFMYIIYFFLSFHYAKVGRVNK